jgi:tetratricopeptide (TPR) repeat protein
MVNSINFEFELLWIYHDLGLNFNQPMSDNTPEYWKNKGNEEVKLNNFDRGLEFYKKALEIDPDYLPALHNLGLVYKQIGKEKESEFYFNRELEIENNYQKQFDKGLFNRLGNGIKSGTRWMTY